MKVESTSGGATVKIERRCSKKAKLLLCIGFGLACAIGLGVGLGIYFNQPPTEPVKVQKLPLTATAARRRLTPTLWASDTLTSLSAFSFMKLETFKLTVFELQLVPKGVDYNTDHGAVLRTDYNAGECSVDIASDQSRNKCSVQARPGDYDGMNMNIDLKFLAKGYCRTNTTIVYTTANGLGSIPISSLTASPPHDYDQYLFTPASYGTQTGNGGGPNNGNYFNGNSYYPFTFVPGGTSAILLDSNFMLACYDGTLAGTITSFLSSTPGLDPYGIVAPFNSYNPQNPTYSQYTPSAPQIGLQYLALFFYGGGDTGNSTSILPVGETYIYSYSASDIQAFTADATSPLDILKFSVMTIAFNPDNTILGIQVRGAKNDGGGLGAFKNMKLIGPNTYSMENRAQPKMFSDDGKVDLVFTNFTRIVGDDYTTVVPVQLVDGPNCYRCVQMPCDTRNVVQCFGSKILYFRKFRRT